MSAHTVSGKARALTGKSATSEAEYESTVADVVYSPPDTPVGWEVAAGPALHRDPLKGAPHGLMSAKPVRPGS